MEALDTLAAYYSLLVAGGEGAAAEQLRQLILRRGYEIEESAHRIRLVPLIEQ